MNKILKFNILMMLQNMFVRITMMDQDMKEKKLMEKDKEEDNSIMLKEVHMMDYGMIIECMGEEFYITNIINLPMMENGLMINSKEKELYITNILNNLMEISIIKDLITQKNIGLNMKEDSLMIKKKDLV